MSSQYDPETAIAKGSRPASALTIRWILAPPNIQATRCSGPRQPAVLQRVEVTAIAAPDNQGPRPPLPVDETEDPLNEPHAALLGTPQPVAGRQSAVGRVLRGRRHPGSDQCDRPTPEVPICARGSGAMAGLSSEHSVCINQADRSALCRRWVRVFEAGAQRLTGIETEASVLTGGCVSPPLGGPCVIGCDITPFQRYARALVASGSTLTSVVPVDSARRRSRS